MTLLGIVFSLAATVFAAWAVRIALRTERHTLEANDVAWSAKQNAAGWGFWFSGSTPLQELKVVLTVDGEVHETRCAALEPGKVLTVEHPRELELREEAVEEAEEFERSNEERSRPITTEFLGSTIELFPGAAPLPDLRPLIPVDVSALIFWRSPSGVPRSHSWSSRSTYEADQHYGQ